MSDLLKFKAKMCNTVAGFAVKDGKVLLVKHKKLGIWLAPGGHIEMDELPHQAAEREFKEETGLTAKAVVETRFSDSDNSEYLPNPIATNLHWINKGTCEQHLCWIYKMKLVNSEETLQHDPNESDDIGWFSQKELDDLETPQNIKDEARLAFSLSEAP